MKTPIRSSDPDAVEKLHSEIQRLEASQTMMRDANDALRHDNVAALKVMGFSEEHIADLVRKYAAGGAGFPQYALRNNNSNIRRLKARVKELTEREVLNG